jgi:hypothetical protein
MGLPRHGGMGRPFTGFWAPITLGTFLRSFAFGHMRQLDAVAARRRSRSWWTRRWGLAGAGVFGVAGVFLR